MAHENNGHRARIRERMMKEGLSGFQDHEVLEMLLFQYLPRKDTNKIAHNLLTQFGSFSGVLNASADQLMMVKGISKVTACNLTLLKEVFARYRQSSAHTINLGSMESIINYGRILTQDNYCEKLVVVYVDQGTNFLYSDVFTSHSIDKVNVEIKQIVASAMRTNAAGVVLFHCHVKGACLPSKADLDFTQQLHIALTSIDMVLLEHLIFNNSNDRYSFYEHGLIKEFGEKYNKAF